jgi:hypothetical protein
MASVRNKTTAQMTDTQVLNENLKNQHQVTCTILYFSILFLNFDRLFLIIQVEREALDHTKRKEMLKVQAMDNKLIMKDSWRQDRKESERLQRQAEMEIQFKQIERITQHDADRLESKKRKADREERVIDTEMQAKRLQNQRIKHRHCSCGRKKSKP